MNRRYSKRLGIASLAFAISTGLIVPVYADGDSTAAESVDLAGAASIGSVSIGQDSYIKLNSASVLAGDDGKTVTFHATVYNGSDEEIQFIDYWVRLLNGSGSQFTVNILPQDKDKNKIPAHSSIDVGFYAKVDANTALSDLIFRFIKWDFNADNYERSLGEITIPSDYSTVTPAGQSSVFAAAGTSLQASIKRTAMGKNDDYYLPTVTLSLENVGMKGADLTGYTYLLQTSEGYQYSFTPAADNKTMAPRVKKDLLLTFSVPRAVDPNGWKLIIVKDTGGSGTDTVRLPMASFALPEPSAGGTSDSGSTASIDFGDQTVKTGIKRLSVNKTDTNNIVNLYFTFENDGVNAVTIADTYQFSLITKDGLTYPLSKMSAITLNPRESKDVQLSVTIPGSVNIDDMKLQLNQSGGANGQSYPVATYTVPAASVNYVSVGTEYSYTNANGTYAVKLDHIERLPWNDQDILSAEVTITNKSSTLLRRPAVQGHFVLDGNVSLDASLQEIDKIDAIPAGSSVTYILYKMIPYTYQFNDIRLVLEEKAGENNTPTIAEFRNNSELLNLPTIAKDETYNIHTVGKSAAVKVSNVKTYIGSSDDLYYAELEVQNLEKRFAKPGSLTGFIKTKDDLYFPFSATTIGKAVMPNGKALLALWSTLPKGYSMKDLELVIGEAVTDGSSAVISPADNTATSLVRAVDMQLPDENVKVASSLSSIAVGPYTLSISDMKSSPSLTTSKSFDVTASYKLTKSDVSLPSLPTDKTHKLVFEFSSAGVTNSKVFTLETTQASTDGKFSLGEGLSTPTMTISAPDYDAYSSMVQSQTYTLKVYDDMGGYRNLLASTSGSWITN